MGAASERPLASLVQVGERLRPDVSFERMVSERLDVLGEPLRVAPFDRLDDPGVERAPAVVEQARVRDS